MENIAIRNVTSYDAEFLFKLMNNEHIIERLNEIETEIDTWASAVTEWENDPDEEDYLIYNDNIPIGWLGINNLLSSDKQVYIKVIALMPEYQEKGIGKYVISQIIKNLRLRGYTSIGLYTDCTNIIAQQCYIRCGFCITDTIIQKMSNGESIKRLKMETTL